MRSRVIRVLVMLLMFNARTRNEEYETKKRTRERKKTRAGKNRVDLKIILNNVTIYSAPSRRVV